jgi:hypothetical protein
MATGVVLFRNPDGTQTPKQARRAREWAAQCERVLAIKRKYSQELRDLRKRLNIKPHERISYNIAAPDNTDPQVPASV